MRYRGTPARKLHSHPMSLVALLISLAISACGIPSTSVVQVGEPATGIDMRKIRVYFWSGGNLTSLPRLVDTTGNVQTAVELLFAGPTEDEAARVTTELPRPAVDPLVLSSHGSVTIALPELSVPLSHAAMDQLVCTAARAEEDTRTPRTREPTMNHGPGEVKKRMRVHVRGSGWSLTQTACPMR